MKIKNKDVTIKIGKKQLSFKNLILDSYIELFRDSFLEFKNKTLNYCFLKFNSFQEINCQSKEMDYDVVLTSRYEKIHQIYTENVIINKYIYDEEYIDNIDFTDTINNHSGEQLCGVGFGRIEYEEEKPKIKIYAFLDVSKYNIIVQEFQKIIISRVDKVTTDLLFFSPFADIKYPYHLTIAGLFNLLGMEYNNAFPKLKSIGLGNLYNVIRDEKPVEELNIEKKGIDTIKIGPITLKNESDGLYPSFDLYPSEDLYPQKATPRWIIYKFEIFEILEQGEEEPQFIDTGKYYYQCQYIDRIGEINLKIKYERG